MQGTSAIHYQFYPNSNATQTLVFIHGYACSSVSWIYQVPYFYPDYNLLTLDLRGHGGSHTGMPDAKFDVPLFAGDISDLLQQLNLSSGVSLIAHSASSRVAVEVYNQCKEWLDFISMTLIDCGYYTIADAGLTSLTRNLFPHGYVRGIKDFFAPTFLDSTPQYIRDLIMQDALSLTEEVGIQFLPNVQMYDSSVLPQVLQQMEIPLLVVQATLRKDGKRLTITEDNAKYSDWLNLIGDTVKNHTIKIIPDTGHFIMLERPAMFNTLLSEFLHTL